MYLLLILCLKSALSLVSFLVIVVLLLINWFLRPCPLSLSWGLTFKDGVQVDDKPTDIEQLSKSPFIPDVILNEFNKLPTDHKTKYCGFENYSPKKNIINKDLAKKILGYN